MTNPFSTLEIQLIRSSLTSKTDEEIAELLEKPIADVVMKIDEITNGGAAERMIAIDAERRKIVQEKLEKKKKKLVVKNDRKVKDEQYEKKDIKIRRSIEFEEKQRRKELESRAINRKFETRHIDFTIMKSVRVNRTTHVWVPKDMSDAEAIKKYHDNLDHYNRKHLPTN